MTADKKYEKRFGLDMPFDEAIGRFAQVTKEELESEGYDENSIVPDGQCEMVLFKQTQIRKICHKGEWWFSVSDVVRAIMQSDDEGAWRKIKSRLKQEGSDVVADCDELKLPIGDGRMYPTDCANIETLFRIIQAIPSKHAEPFKRWLARVGYERIQEIQNPEIAIKRAILQYQIQGRSDDWIEKRIRSIVTRKELTSEWKKRGVDESKEYAQLTNLISTETFGGITVKGHKDQKGLSASHNLRDHMTDLELIFTMLGEKSTTEIARARDAQGFHPNLKAAKSGGMVAGVARKQLESETGETVVSRSNFLGGDKRTADPQLLTSKKTKK